MCCHWKSRQQDYLACLPISPSLVMCEVVQSSQDVSDSTQPTALIKLVKLFLQSSGKGEKLVNGRGKPPSRPPSARSGVLPSPRPRIWPGEDSHAHPFWEWASWCDQEYPRLIQGSQGVVIMGNIDFLTSCSTPRLPPVAPPIKILPGGCSPVGIPSLAIG